MNRRRRAGYGREARDTMKLGEGLKTVGMQLLQKTERIACGFKNPGVWIPAAISAVFLLLSGAFTLLADSAARTQYAQQAAERFAGEDKMAQASCFFAAGSFRKQDVAVMEERMAAAMRTYGMDPQPSDGLHAWGRTEPLTLRQEQNSLRVQAVGVEGDFFQFHPLELAYGTWFQTQRPGLEAVLLSEDAAFGLFGACDVAGLTVRIGAASYPVAGVVRPAADSWSAAAAAEEPVIYVPLSLLDRQGTGKRAQELDFYEAVMPEPFRNFAVLQLEERLQLPEETVEIVSNHDRYGWAASLARWKERKRSGMQLKPIAFPWWENAARGAQERVDACRAGTAAGLVIAAVCLLVFGRKLYSLSKFTE